VHGNFHNTTTDNRQSAGPLPNAQLEGLGGAGSKRSEHHWFMAAGASLSWH